MAGPIDYKQKYMELKARFMSAIDSAWQDGYQHGMVDSQTEQAQQEKQQADAMAAGIGQPGQEGEAEQPGEQSQAEGQPVSQNPNGEDELGQHIEKLESMISKSDASPFELQELKKTLNDIKSLQIQINLTKSMESIKNTKLKKSFQPIKFTKKLESNLKEPAKKALSLQQEILGNVFAKWEKDESKAAGDIGSILNIQGLTKKD
jgi:hypothetical protein